MVSYEGPHSRDASILPHQFVDIIAGLMVLKWALGPARRKEKKKR